MMCRRVLILLLATSVLTDDHLSEAEIVVERPGGSAVGTTSGGVQSIGGEEDSFRKSRQMDTELTQRQGPFGRPNMVSMTVNALNPMPYVMGGLKGVRDVVRQRFFPWRGMVLDNFARVFPRQRFRGGGPRPIGMPGPGFHGGPVRQSFGGGIEHGGGGGGGGGGVHIGGGGSFKGSVGSSSSRFRDEVSPLTTDDPSGVHTPLRGSIEKGNLDFNTPKPKSIISASSMSTESSGADNKPHRPNDIRNDVFSLSNLKTSTPSFSSSPAEELSSGHDIVSPLVPTEKTKVISIEIPKEFDDLSVLEVSMKSNGDVSVGSKNVTNHAAFPEPFSRANPHFSATWNDHKFTSQSKVESRLTNPSNLHIGIPTNPDNYRGSITCLNALNNGQVKSIQDVLCMQNSGNNNKIHGNSIRPEFSSIGNQHQSDIQNNGIDNSFQRQNPVPHFSANFGPDKQNINHIYFVPLSVPAPHHSIIPQVHGASMSNTQHVSSFSQSSRTIPKERDPNVFYIDITIPGTEKAEPSIRSRSKRSLQFDGWYPMDVSNPMSDEPTLGYQPPPLERVHFSDDPVTDKPMYPVKPKNPTVFVVRAEPREPELHSVYGTENVEYFHIHPQTNTIRAFRAPDQSIGAIQFVSPPQFGESEGNSNHKKSETKSITEKEVGSGSEDGLFDDIRFIDTASQYASDYDLDMDGSFSEYSPVVVRPHDFHRRDPPGFRRYEFQETPARRRVDVIDLPPSRQRDTSRSSRPALYELLGNVKYESQIEETPYLGSATDSARTSVFREVPPPNFFQGQTSGRYSSQNVDKDIRRSGPRRPSYRNTGLDDSSSHPWYLIDTKSERRREPSIASYIHPETRLGDERVHYKPFGPVAYVSKDSERTRQRDSIYNPHLDDHMNSYKPSTSLIANSLSELLQIFKYTQVTDKPGKDSPGEDGITLVREFRYTRPTEETPTTVSSFEENLSSDNGYTSTPPSVKNDITRNVTANPEKVSYDAVADTNSLDGYLFSDSEASPEYAHPEVKPNIVIIEGKDIATSKGLIKDNIRPTSVIRPNATRENVRITSASSRTEKPTFGGLEIIYPGPEPKTTTSRSSLSSWPLYVIHEGHSKVKLFGINTTKDKNSLSKNIELLHLTEEPTTFATETEPPETTTTIPFTSTNLDITSTHILVDHNSTYLPTTTLEPTSTSPTFDTDNQDVPRENTNNNSEYEYYYYDEEELVPEAAFAGSYHSEGWEHPSLRLPGPPVSPVALNIPPPVPSQRSLAGDIVIPPSSAAFAHVFQERLPRPEGVASLSPDQIPLLPDVSLTRDQLSVGRPVFFTKRQQQQQPDVAEKDASISQPFEYLSHLRELGREKRSSTTHERDSVQLGEEGQRASEINSQA